MVTDAVPATKCPLCEDTGWKTSSVDRKVRTVTPCDCRVAARNAKLLAQAGIPAQYEHCTLDNFNVTFPGAGKSLGNALFFARKFVEKYLSEKTGMLLSGGCGTGKTHLAVAILRELVQQRGAQGLFCGYSALLKQIQATFSPQIVADEETGVVLTEYSLLQSVTQAEVLVLDDLGTEELTAWTRNLIYYVINERYNARRTTIITTNLQLRAPEIPPSARESEKDDQARKVMRVETVFERISERAYSRITEMCPHQIELYGPDYRRILSAH